MMSKKRFLLKAIGLAIQEMRKIKGLTLEDVASQVGITKEELIEIESGRVKNITKEDLEYFFKMVKIT